MVKSADSSSSSSSSIDSSNHPYDLSSASSFIQPNMNYLRTDLSLGLSISSSTTRPDHSPGSSRDKQADWPPVKWVMRNTLSKKNGSYSRPTLFVKVYMEGILIGRKLDLFCYDGYHALISTLAHMFRTTILFPGVDERANLCNEDNNVVTYEDKEGDWMMVGDVPWKVFLASVKRLKISRAHKC